MNTDKQKGAAKTARIPIKIVPQPRMRLPSWIRAKSPNVPNVARLKGIFLRYGERIFSAAGIHRSGPPGAEYTEYGNRREFP